MIAHDQAPEHEFEAVPGLPEALPENERLLWQGSPGVRSVMRQVMHLRLLAFYFSALLAWQGMTRYVDSHSVLQAVQSMVLPGALALMATGTLAVLAWLISRTTLYSITDRRVVMRVGVVLSVTFNLPFSRIDAAGLRLHADGSGDVTLLLNQADRIAFLHLWPHVRPWRVRHAEPMLRGVPDGRRVAALLSGAMNEAAGSRGRPLAARASVPVGAEDTLHTGAGGQQPLAA